MFRSFFSGVIPLAFFAIVSDMLMPEGTLKKYMSLTFGFMMMCTLIAPVKSFINTTPFEFSFDAEMSNEEITAKSDAYVLKLHEENIREYIRQIIGENAEVFIDLYSDGQVREVIIYTDTNNPLLLSQLKQTLGCDNIRFSKRNKYDT